MRTGRRAGRLNCRVGGAEAKSTDPIPQMPPMDSVEPVIGPAEAGPVGSTLPTFYTSWAARPSDTLIPESCVLNIVDPILAQCRFQPDAPAVCVPGPQHATIAYGQLARLINNAARHAARVGLGRGDTVVLYVTDLIGQAVLILGLAKAGVVTISGRGPDLPPELKVDAVVADVESGLPAGKRIIAADARWMDGDGSPFHGDGGSGDETARIVFTSGTTGVAKAVAFSHRMVAERIARFDYLGGSLFAASHRACLDLGFSTSLGYLFLVYVLSRGGLVILPGSAYENVANACAFYGADAWLGSPGGLVKVLEHYEARSDQRCTLRGMLAGGSFLAQSLSERVRARVCANLISAYGSTETNMVATAPAHLTAVTPGAVGHLTPGMVVEAVDEDDRPLGIGREGLMRIRGPYNVAGYVGAPEESARAFRDGWFYPGDIGRVTADNLLIITARQKAVMNIGGDKVSPETIEATLCAYPGIDRAGVISVANTYGIEEIWAAVASRDGINEERLRLYCQGLLPPAFMPRRFVRLDEVPVNEMGKVDRRRLVELLNDRSP
jgi:fatty-acyl-CoA synthase